MVRHRACGWCVWPAPAAHCPHVRGTGAPATDQQPEQHRRCHPGRPRQAPGQSQLSAWEFLLKTMKEMMAHETCPRPTLASQIEGKGE